MNRLKPKILITAFLTLLSFLYSCQDEVYDMLNSKDQEIINKARIWYNLHYPTISELPNLPTARKGNIKKLLITPKWKNAFVTQNQKYTVIEIALKGRGFLGTSTSEAHEKWKNKNDRRYISSIWRLLIIKRNQSNIHYAFYMNIMGDVQYLESFSSNIWKNSFLNFEDNFTGNVLYFNINGAFNSGYGFKQGSLVNTINFNDSNLKLPMGRIEEEICESNVIWVTYEQCTDYYTLGELLDGNLDNPYDSDCKIWQEFYAEVEYCFNVEDPNDPNGGSGGGSSGGSPGGGSPDPAMPLDNYQNAFLPISYEESSNSEKTAYLLNYLRYNNCNNQNVNLENIFTDIIETGTSADIFESYTTNISLNGQTFPIYMEVPRRDEYTVIDEDISNSNQFLGSDGNYYHYLDYGVECGGCSYPIRSVHIAVPSQHFNSIYNFLSCD